MASSKGFKHQASAGADSFFTGLKPLDGTEAKKQPQAVEQTQEYKKVLFRIPAALKQRAEDQAWKERKTLTEYIVSAIEKDLAAHEE